MEPRRLHFSPQKRSAEHDPQEDQKMPPRRIKRPAAAAASSTTASSTTATAASSGRAAAGGTASTAASSGRAAAASSGRAVAGGTATRGGTALVPRQNVPRRNPRNALLTTAGRDGKAFGCGPILDYTIHMAVDREERKCHRQRANGHQPQAHVGEGDIVGGFVANPLPPWKRDAVPRGAYTVKRTHGDFLAEDGTPLAFTFPRARFFNQENVVQWDGEDWELNCPVSVARANQIDAMTAEEQIKLVENVLDPILQELNRNGCEHRYVKGTPLLELISSGNAYLPNPGAAGCGYLLDPDIPEHRDACYVIKKVDHTNTLYDPNTNYGTARLLAVAHYKPLADHIPDATVLNGSKLIPTQSNYQAHNKVTDLTFTQNFIGQIILRSTYGWCLPLSSCGSLKSLKTSEPALYWCFALPLAMFMVSRMDPKLKSMAEQNIEIGPVLSKDQGNFTKNLLKKVAIGVWSPKWVKQQSAGSLEHNVTKSLEYVYCRSAALVVPGFPKRSTLKGKKTKNKLWITEEEEEKLGQNLVEGLVVYRFPHQI
ncbi:unknown protein [Seminavis robusta]|uniref:Uncharacterized protein n=1 Tax=Seminavis robusta TaxID=568900 RepID=A0A9N8DW05_9STRA|nr:unknown protein [Seminavis robusta]|eukprot:Sro398_g134770.1 n/a (541) ;mRNA; r:59640-61262